MASLKLAAGRRMRSTEPHPARALLDYLATPRHT
jgi:hypothetical protein